MYYGPNIHKAVSRDWSKLEKYLGGDHTKILNEHALYIRNIESKI